jgi:hypothetical protein
MIEFSDGVSFDTDGPLRVERRRDGYYIVGEGFLAPVESSIEGYKWIKQYREDQACRRQKT